MTRMAFWDTANLEVMRYKNQVQEILLVHELTHPNTTSQNPLANCSKKYPA